MISAHDIASLVGRHVVDSEGHKVGTVGQVFVDPASGNPNWVTVKTGLFGSSESFVPLEQAEEAEGELRIPYGKDAVKGAPRFDTDAELTQRQEEELYAYYALRDPREGSESGSGSGQDQDADGRGDDAGRHHHRHEHEGHEHDHAHDHDGEHSHDGAHSGDHDHDHDHDHDDAAGAAGADATTPVPAPRDANAAPAPVAGSGLRLRRYVVTEQVTVTVPVAREEVRLEPESPTGSTPDQGADTPPTDR